MTGVDISTPVTEAGYQVGKEIFPPLRPSDVVRVSILGRSDYSGPIQGKHDHQVMDLMRLPKEGVLVPVYYNTANPVDNQPVPGLSINSLHDFISYLSFTKEKDGPALGEIATPELVERMRVCLVDLHLPPLISAILAGKNELSLDEIRAKYDPRGQTIQTKLVDVIGKSRSWKTTYLAKKVFKGEAVAVGIEPFSPWSLGNMLDVLEASGLDRNTATDQEIVDAIQKGMKIKIDSGDLRPQETSLSPFVGQLLSPFETGKIRPEVMFVDVTGIPSDGERPLQSPDLLTFWGYDATLTLERIPEAGKDVYTDPGDYRVLADYEAQQEKQEDSYMAVAANNQAEWIRKLDWDCRGFIPPTHTFAQ